MTCASSDPVRSACVDPDADGSDYALMRGHGPSTAAPSPRRRGALARLAALACPYDACDPDAPRFRARQLQAVLRFTPAAMAVNLVNVAVLVPTFWGTPQGSFALAWAVAVTLLAAYGLCGWMRARQRPVRGTASPRALRHAAWQAGLRGLAWAALPAVAFAGASPDAQLLLGMVFTGMLCAGAFALSSVPTAVAAYAGALWAGAMVAMLRWDAAIAMRVAILLTLYTGTIVYAALAYSRTLVGRLLAEAQAERQRGVIGLLLRDFEDHASGLLWETDARGRFVHVAPRLASAFGVPHEALRRAQGWTLVARHATYDGEARDRWHSLRDALRRGQPFRDRVLCVRTARGEHWWSVSARPLRDDRSRLIGWRGVAADITDRQRAHRKLRWLAHNDALTGLVNRAHFRDRLQAWMQASRGMPSSVAVLTFDLDGFKQVNDSRGHAAGDELLRTFAERLLAAVRRDDVVARLGGDEFAILVHEVATPGDVEPLLRRIEAVLASPARLDGHAVPLRASIGVAFAPADGEDVDTLLSAADAAMYAAKHQGGRRWRLFDASLAELARRRAVLAQDLTDAIERGELRLEYQPQVDSRDLGLRGLEALLRWRHPAHGDVDPAEFVAIAESTRLMVRIGEWVLEEACRQARRWPNGIGLSVNVSAKQLVAPGFVEHVARSAAGLAPGQLELEVTESALIEDTETTAAVLRALRAQGHRTALDDFGTGHSALAYLRRFPFDTLKIDRSFVTDLGRQGDAQVIVDTIVAMSRALRMATVAEGVETAEQAALLRDKGCTALQGWLVSRPLPADDVDDFVARWTAGEGRPLLDAA